MEEARELGTMSVQEEEPASIDAVVQSPIDEVSTPEPQSPQPDGIPELSGKRKGRKRMMLGLHRIASTGSLARMGRSTPMTSYRSGAGGTCSCISLASTGSNYQLHHTTSYESEFGAQFSTAPTSVSGSPGPATPRIARSRSNTLGKDTPTSVGLPSDVRPSSRMGQCVSVVEEEGYASKAVPRLKKPPMKRRKDFNFWKDLPGELRMEILGYLGPKQLVRCSTVCKTWHQMCFDGQLWSNLDTSEYYRDISAEALIRIVATAGPFVRDLNLRGCVQLREQWNRPGFVDACSNLENISVEGCLIDRSSIHCFLLANSRLVHINLSGLATATNQAMRIIGTRCPKVEHLNVTWCNNIDTKGIRYVVEGCPNLKDLRAGEVRGWDDFEVMKMLFERNNLERLILTNCDSLTDDAFTTFLEGVDGEYDYLTGRVIVPPRRLKHLDLTRCRGLTDAGVKKLAHNVPLLEGLQLSKCHAITDDALADVLPTLPMLTHLDLEELAELSNNTLQSLAASPCTKYLQHLSISYCESLGDAGMLPVLKNCTNLRSLDMDNTRVSDLVLTECAAAVRTRNRMSGRGVHAKQRPGIGLRIVAYDCANVTWTGVREILSRNAEAQRVPGQALLYPAEIVQLKCFYNWQPTVEEHTKRVLRGDFAAAARLERKWADWMMLNEEAGVGGAGGRRRRRRAREAQLLHADESEDGPVGVGGVRRRRARSGPNGCVVM